MNRYYVKNRDKRLKYQLDYYKKNSDKIKMYQKKYYHSKKKKNRNIQNEVKREYTPKDFTVHFD